MLGKPPSRRDFLAAAAAGAALGKAIAAQEFPVNTIPGTDVPLVDFHVHLDNFTLDEALALSRERGVTFGIVEHAGTKENKYPVVLSNDAELRRHIARLEGKPVFKGVQTEWTDWMSCFSKEAVAALDYVLTDAMTFPGRDGRRVKLWQKDAPQRVDMADREAFMDRYVDWYVQIMAKQPIDILANATWLPRPLAGDWDAFWTPARVSKVLDAALKYNVAIEISSSLKLPKLSFLRQARKAGVKLSFGSNGRRYRMGKLDYCIEMAKKLGLRREHMFMPAPPGKKPVEVRRL